MHLKLLEILPNKINNVLGIIPKIDHVKEQGNLFTQVRETMKLLLTKYLKAFISYKGLYRVESYPVPESAFREALINVVSGCTTKKDS